MDLTLAPGSYDQRKTIRQAIPRFYNVYLFFGLTNLIAWGAVTWAFSGLSQVTWWEWLFLPIIFLTLNYGEYYLHQGPMHQASKGSRLLFNRHTRQHHRYFTHETMDIEDSREAYLILFPPWAIIMLLLFASLAGWIVSLFSTDNIALLFFGSLMSYYIIYEWMHLICHLQGKGILAGNSVVTRISSHHTRHHNPAVMTKGNFNFAFPVFDWLFKTRV